MNGRRMHTCAICLEELPLAPKAPNPHPPPSSPSSPSLTSPSTSASSFVGVLACGHSFHQECIQLWARTVNSCPLDRTEFLGITVLDHVNGNVIERIPIESSKQRVQENEQDLLQDADNQVVDFVCQICLQGDREESLLLCEMCDDGYHTDCVQLARVPDGDWYCPVCTEIRQSANRAPNHRTTLTSTRSSALTTVPRLVSNSSRARSNHNGILRQIRNQIHAERLVRTSIMENRSYVFEAAERPSLQSRGRDFYDISTGRVLSGGSLPRQSRSTFTPRASQPRSDEESMWLEFERARSLVSPESSLVEAPKGVKRPRGQSEEHSSSSTTSPRTRSARTTISSASTTRLSVPVRSSSSRNSIIPRPRRSSNPLGPSLSNSFASRAVSVSSSASASASRLTAGSPFSSIHFSEPCLDSNPTSTSSPYFTAPEMQKQRVNNTAFEEPQEDDIESISSISIHSDVSMLEFPNKDRRSLRAIRQERGFLLKRYLEDTSYAIQYGLGSPSTTSDMFPVVTSLEFPYMGPGSDEHKLPFSTYSTSTPSPRVFNCKKYCYQFIKPYLNHLLQRKEISAEEFKTAGPMANAELMEVMTNGQMGDVNEIEVLDCAGRIVLENVEKVRKMAKSRVDTSSSL